jgi:hypothetical protein
MKLALYCALVVLLIDAIGATLARLLDFGYGWVVIPSLLCYAALGAVISWRTGKWWYGSVALLIAAVADGTMGWVIAAAIGPGRAADSRPSLIAIAAMGGIATNWLVGTIAALAGTFAAALVKRSHKAGHS